MTRRFLLAAVAAGILWAAPAAVAAGMEGVVAEIVDGDTVLLAEPVEDSREIRLVGIQAPKLPLGRRNFKTWPLADEAKAALAELVLGKRVRLWFGGVRKDRYNRWLAHLDVVDGGSPLWVQGEMLTRGMARVYSFKDNRARVEDMLERERAARAAGRGIWGHSFYAVREPDAAALVPLLGTFQIVEGRVRDAVDVKGTLYLNFGADWRTDFTVAVERRDRKLFEESAIDLRSFKGATIRVRGWLKDRNGPMIVATHPEQIERF